MHYISRPETENDVAREPALAGAVGVAAAVAAAAAVAETRIAVEWVTSDQ